MNLEELKGYSPETQIALLATSYSLLSKTVESMETKLDSVIDEATKRKGSSSVWNKLGAIALSVVSGGGAGWILAAAKGVAATTTIVNTTNGTH